MGLNPVEASEFFSGLSSQLRRSFSLVYVHQLTCIVHECFVSFREICEKLGITAFSVDDVDKYGLDEVVQRSLDKINPG